MDEYVQNEPKEFDPKQGGIDTRVTNLGADKKIYSFKMKKVDTDGTVLNPGSTHLSRYYIDDDDHYQKVTDIVFVEDDVPDQVQWTWQWKNLKYNEIEIRYVYVNYVKGMYRKTDQTLKY